MDGAMSDGKRAMPLSRHSPSAQAPRRRRPVRAWPRSAALRRGLSAAFFLVAAILIYRQVSSITLSALMSALAATNPAAIGFSIVLTVASYLCLSGTEWLSLHALGHRFSFRHAAMVAMPSYALTNTAGFSPATGAALRLQLYARQGFSPGQSATVALVAGSAVTLSGFVTAGLLVAASPRSIHLASVGATWLRPAVAAVLLAPAGLWFWAFSARAPRWLGGAHPTDLSVAQRLAGLAVGIGDWLFSGAALFVLLPHLQLAAFPTFLAAYIAGSLLSAATGVPGGIGVFEAIVLALTSVLGQLHETAAALLLYRCIYSLGPLSLFGGLNLARRVRGAPAMRRRAMSADSGSPREAPPPSKGASPRRAPRARPR